MIDLSFLDALFGDGSLLSLIVNLILGLLSAFLGFGT